MAFKKTGLVPHATISDSTTQGVVSTSVEYPLLLNTNDDISAIGVTHDIVGVTVTMTIASPAVVTWTSHGLKAGSPVQFTTDGALPTGVTAGTVYYVIATDLGTDTFKFSTAPGGAAVNTTGTQSGTHKATSKSRIYVSQAGDYLVAVSLVIDTTSNTAAIFDLWIKINGVNLANSNTQVAINSNNQQQVLAVTFIIDLVAGDFFEFFYHATATNARVLAVAAQTGPPVIPACPSAIICMSRICD